MPIGSSRTAEEEIEGQRLEINRLMEFCKLKDDTIAAMTTQRNRALEQIPLLIAQINAKGNDTELHEQIASLRVDLDKEIALRLQRDFPAYLKQGGFSPANTGGTQ